MLSIAAISGKGFKYYYVPYEPGQWSDDGGKALGLEGAVGEKEVNVAQLRQDIALAMDSLLILEYILNGAVEEREFNNLLRGFSPDGSLPLVQNAREHILTPPGTRELVHENYTSKT